MKMMEAGALAKRFERYSDAEIEATLDEIATIEKFGMTAFERSMADDIRAEHARRQAMSAAANDVANVHDGKGST